MTLMTFSSKFSLEFASGPCYNSPTVKFLTHSAITPMRTPRTILSSIPNLLGEPNTNSPLNTHATELWKIPTSL
ncbi:unnamed protein product [Nyctereutes procyonoides]|uniref:(raccoon dog) hypothetical protein n=1 Tax=Nyctereutes procyonoides TaxID=34880 RepID=A0A811Z461_NYCPR|nr:unnamed protein product [Nyctereutes procyonoides]